VVIVEDDFAHDPKHRELSIRDILFGRLRKDGYLIAVTASTFLSFLVFQLKGPGSARQDAARVVHRSMSAYPLEH